MSRVTSDAPADRPTVRDHPWLVALGLAAVAAGIGAAVGLDAVPDLPARVGVQTVALLSLAGALAVALWRLTVTHEQAEPTDVEFRGDVRVPGTEFDELLAAASSGLQTSRLKARRQVIDRLEAVAVEVHAQRERVPVAEARETVEEGTWTDDRAAAALLAGDTSVSSPVDWVRSVARRRSRLEINADRVTRALADRTPGVDLNDRVDDDPPDAVDTVRGDPRPRGRQTKRWTGLVGLALVTIGIGAANSVGSTPPSLVVAAAALVGVAGLVYLAPQPTPTITIERDVDPPRAEAGERVVVTVTVTNTGDGLLPDVRVVDGVPPGLRVVDGSPRFATALRSGRSATFAYAVEASRGRHTFDPAQVLVRDFGGAVEREAYVGAGDDENDAVEVSADLLADTDVPVRPHTARRVGRVLTDEGGSGVEFHSVREYRQDDPLSRVDWNRLAATGEFATLQFREEHAATVVVLVDARQEAYVAPRVDAPGALEWELTAADLLVASLLASGDAVGLGAVSPEWCWLEPRGGAGQRARARDLLESHPAFDAARPGGGFRGAIAERSLRQELPADAQIVLLTPLCDDGIVSFARSLHARGYPVTVVSPDPTATRTTGQRLAVVERAMRASRLRRAGIRVVDWQPDRPLETAVDAARRRWSA